MKKQIAVNKLSAVLCLGLVTGWLSPVRGQDQFFRPSPGAASVTAAEDREKDKENMLTIYKALKAYEKDRGELPNWLSDLFPKHLQDTNVLVSPIFLRTGRQVLYGNEDPKLVTSYIYEFSAKPVPSALRSAFPQLAADATMRDWKMKQTEEFGPVVPILRCHLYQPVLSVTLDGEFFESSVFWETDPKTLEMRKQRRAARSKSGEERPSP